MFAVRQSEIAQLNSGGRVRRRVEVWVTVVLFRLILSSILIGEIASLGLRCRLTNNGSEKSEAIDAFYQRSISANITRSQIPLWYSCGQQLYLHLSSRTIA